MLKIVSVLTFYVVICSADIPVAPPVRCGYIPNDIYSCLGNPKVIKPNVSSKCKKNVNQCERMTCLFRESGWMVGDKVEKKKVTDHFDEYKKEFPQWTAAVDNLKTSCLTTDLPPQGAFINCPAFDVMLCSLTSFIKSAQPAQWSTEPSCGHARQYAAACPVCPDDCFALLVPAGSCNSCLLLPRSP